MWECDLHHVRGDGTGSNALKKIMSPCEATDVILSRTRSAVSLFTVKQLMHERFVQRYPGTQLAVEHNSRGVHEGLLTPLANDRIPVSNLLNLPTESPSRTLPHVVVETIPHGGELQLNSPFPTPQEPTSQSLDSRPPMKEPGLNRGQCRPTTVHARKRLIRESRGTRRG